MRDRLAAGFFGRADFAARLAGGALPDFAVAADAAGFFVPALGDFLAGDLRSEPVADCD
jgi:hypothetical protein